MSPFWRIGGTAVTVEMISPHMRRNSGAGRFGPGALAALAGPLNAGVDFVASARRVAAAESYRQRCHDASSYIRLLPLVKLLERCVIIISGSGRTLRPRGDRAPGGDGGDGGKETSGDEDDTSFQLGFGNNRRTDMK